MKSEGPVAGRGSGETEELSSRDNRLGSSETITPPFDLTDLPIDERWVEKDLVDDGLDIRLPSYLVKKAGTTNYFTTLPAINRRITEIYRLCYEDSDPKKRNKVLREFVVFYPHLVCHAEWVSELVKHDLQMGYCYPGKHTCPVLLTIANGFHSAADTTARARRLHRQGRISAAKEFRKSEYERLTIWDKNLDRVNAEAFWLAEAARSKADALIKQYPQLERWHVSLDQFLVQADLYKASLLIAAEVFSVPERTLDRNYSGHRKPTGAKTVKKLAKKMTVRKASSHHH
jgi:hypothetical protein